MNEVVGGNLEVDARPERPESFNLRGVWVKGADQDAEAGFNALSQMVKWFDPQFRVGHVLTLGCHDARVAEVGFVTDDRRLKPLNEFRGDARSTTFTIREGIVLRAAQAGMGKITHTSTTTTG